MVSCVEKNTDEFFIVSFEGQYVNEFEISVKDGDKVSEPIKPTFEGRKFLYWATEDGDAYDFALPVREDTVLYAVWEDVKPSLKNFKVRFYDADGKLINEQKVPSGESAKPPVALANQFFVLDGWDKSFESVYEDMDIHLKQRYVGSDPELFTYSRNSDKTYTITGIKDASKLPRTSEGYLKLGLPVEWSGELITEIRDGTSLNGVFGGQKLISVYIPSNYRKIGSYAFYGNPDLNEVTFNEGLVHIGEGAFMATRDPNYTIKGPYAHSGAEAYLSDLTKINLPASLEYIGKYAFNHVGGGFENNNNYVVKNAVLNIAADSKLITIGDYAFEGVMFGDINLSNVSGKLHIGNYAFAADTYLNMTGSNKYPCSRTVKLTLPRNVNYIGERAFYGIGTYYTYYSGNWSVTKNDVEFNAEKLNLEFLGDYAFYDANLTGRLNIEVSKIGTMAFYGHKFTKIECNCKFIGSQAFMQTNDKSVNSTVILSNTDVIDYGAFKDNSGLVALTLPESVYSIGDYAFSGCSALRGKLIFPEKLSHVGNCAFRECGIDQVEIKGNTKLGEQCFENSAVKEITGKITDVGYAAFSGCLNLTTLELPDKLTQVPDRLFKGCVNLSRIILPQSINAIGSEAFASCSSLVSITIPEKVKKIGASAFESCTYLNEVSFEGENIERLEEYTFAFCASLENIDLPDSITFIGDCAFRGSGLISFKTPASLESLGERVFYQEDYIVRDYYVTDDFIFGTIVSRVTLPQIDTFTISTNTGLLEFSPLGTFNGSSIYKFEVEEGNLFYSSVDGLLCSFDRKKLIKHIGDISVVSVDLPYGLEEICERAFYNNSYLYHITLPSTLKTIGDYAFYNCNHLQEIQIPIGVISIGEYAFAGTETNLMELKNLTFASNCELKQIGDFAFSYNKGLTSIIIPHSLVSLGESVFAQSKSLISVDFSNSSLRGTGIMTFSGCSKLLNINFGGLTTVDYGAFSNCSSLTDLTIGNKIEEIGSRAFRNCISLKNMIIPQGNSLKRIMSYAFAGTDSLRMSYEKLDLSNANNLNVIGDYAFAYGDMITANLPNSLFTLGDGAFDSCGKLSYINLGSAVYIGENVFKFCNSLKQIAIPATVTKIAKEAFCSLNLIYVSIGSRQNGITELSIGKNAFFNCRRLRQIEIFGNVVPELIDNEDNNSFCYSDENNSIFINNLIMINIDVGMKDKYLSDAYNGWNVYKSLMFER